MHRVRGGGGRRGTNIPVYRIQSHWEDRKHAERYKFQYVGMSGTDAGHKNKPTIPNWLGKQPDSILSVSRVNTDSQNVYSHKTCSKTTGFLCVSVYYSGSFGFRNAREQGGSHVGEGWEREGVVLSSFHVASPLFFTFPHCDGGWGTFPPWYASSQAPGTAHFYHPYSSTGP